MKQRKNRFLTALLFTLLCFFAACGEAPEEVERTLDDFVYDTACDPDHAISEDELAAMNKIWQREFGRNLGDTPEDAMKRTINGDFYFGRYGRHFVFYRFSYAIDMQFSWKKYTFAFPHGTVYFLNADGIFDQSQAMRNGLLTEEELSALHSFYESTYKDYKFAVDLRDREHVLTQEELDSMNLAYARKTGSKDTYKVFENLGVAMQRLKDRGYYFGKFGDTVVIWSVQLYNELRSFSLCGYDFEFYTGGVLFFDPSGVYRPEDEGFESIMTKDEAEALHRHYSEYYLPFISDPYVCYEFTPELEKLSEDEMRSINEAYDEWKYALEYAERYQKYVDLYPAEEVDRHTKRAVGNEIGYDPHRFFNKDNVKNYQYWGKLGDKVFLAVQNDYAVFKVAEIAGYKFVLDGSSDEIIVYDGGRITRLDEAYENGLVTEAEVAFAHGRHLAYSEALCGGKEEVPPPARLKIGTPYKESPVTLTEDEEREIIWEYIAGDDRIEEALGSTYAVRCYGKFGEVYVVMIDGPWMYTQAMRSESVGGYLFTFPDGQRMRVYKNGAFHSLGKAYELGIISEENVIGIEWAKVAPYTYETSSAPPTRSFIIEYLFRPVCRWGGNFRFY